MRSRAGAGGSGVRRASRAEGLAFGVRVWRFGGSAIRGLAFGVEVWCFTYGLVLGVRA